MMNLPGFWKVHYGFISLTVLSLTETLSLLQRPSDTSQELINLVSASSSPFQCLQTFNLSYAMRFDHQALLRDIDRLGQEKANVEARLMDALARDTRAVVGSVYPQPEPAGERSTVSKGKQPEYMEEQQQQEPPVQQKRGRGRPRKDGLPAGATPVPKKKPHACGFAGPSTLPSRSKAAGAINSAPAGPSQPQKTPKARPPRSEIEVHPLRSVDGFIHPKFPEDKPGDIEAREQKWLQKLRIAHLSAYDIQHLRESGGLKSMKKRYLDEARHKRQEARLERKEEMRRRKAWVIEYHKNPNARQMLRGEMGKVENNRSIVRCLTPTSDNSDTEVEDWTKIWRYVPPKMLECPTPSVGSSLLYELHEGPGL